MWQKCPICNGSGVEPTPTWRSLKYCTCTTCKGEKIISTFTGLPPNSGKMDYQPVEDHFKNISSGDFRDDDNRETQEEYYGKK